MISIEEVKKWLSKNRVDENGNLNLIGLDFSDFDGNVDISNMEVKGNLYQDKQNVGGDLYQYSQKVEGDLRQCFQKAKGGMYLQDTSNLSKFANNHGIAYYKEIPEMTLEEIERELGYKFKLKGTVLL